jgi:serine/threonine protein kinase
MEQLALGELGPTDADELEQHVVHCAECRDALERARQEQVRTREVAISARRDTPRPVARQPIESRAKPKPTPASADEGSDPTHQTRADPDLYPPGQCPDDLRQIAHYRIVRLIGRGGMGIVYWAEDTHLQRPVAIKVLRQRSADNPEVRQRFLREARAMAAIKHDHIAVIYQVSEAAVGDGEGMPYLAMEMLDGENLDTWMRSNPRAPVQWIARLGREAAEGLAAAHACGLLHRDIKPANLWLEAPAGWAQTTLGVRPPLSSVGRIKLLDFGLAQPFDEDGDEESVMGTPAYMAPEQLRGDPLDHRCDLFGLGCVLYQMTTGQHPFPRRERGNTAPWQRFPTPTPVRELRPEVPPRLAGLIERMLSERPGDRPDSARVVAQELRALERDGAAPPGSDFDTEAWPPMPRPRQRRRALLAACLAVLFIVAAALTIGWSWVHNPAPGTGLIVANPVPSTEILRPSAPSSPPSPFAGLPDVAWCDKVAALPPLRQVEVVLAKLQELNPDFDGQAWRVRTDEQQVTEVRIYTDAITDIRPLRALRRLKSLGCTGTVPGKGRLTDLSPLEGMQLDWLFLWHNPELTDIRPLRGMKLIQFEPSHTAVANLDGIATDRLTVLNISWTKITDLRPIHEWSNLRALFIHGCSLESIAPIRNLPLNEIILDYAPERDEAILRGLKLQKINRVSAEEFWRQHPPQVKVPEPS